MLNRNRTDDKTVNSYIQRGIVAFCVVLACIVAFLVIYRFDVLLRILKKILNILSPLIVGIAIAYIINPVESFVEKKTKKLFSSKTKPATVFKLSRSAGIAAAMIVFLIVLGVLCYMIFPQLISSITGMINKLPSQMDGFTKWLDKRVEDSSIIASIVDSVNEYIKKWLQTDLVDRVNVWGGYVADGLLGAFNVVKNITIGIIVAVYVLFSKEVFKRQLKKLVYVFMNRNSAGIFIETARKSNEIFSGFIYGKIIDSLIIGVLCFIGLTILRMPYTLLVSVIVGVTNVIPVFGPYIGAIPSAIIILLDKPIMGLYFLIFIIVLQQFDGNILGPRILGQTTGLSSFWVIFSILLFGGIFGILGMLIGVPVFAVIYYVIKSLIAYRMKKKNIVLDENCNPIDNKEKIQ